MDCTVANDPQAAAQGQPASLLTLPIHILEAICARLSLRDRIALTSCCPALLARPEVSSNEALWGSLVGKWRPEKEPQREEPKKKSLLQKLLGRQRGGAAPAKPAEGCQPPLAAWLGRRLGGLRTLRLELLGEAEAEEVARTLAQAGGLTHLELVLWSESGQCIPPSLASLPPSALVALEVSVFQPRLGQCGQDELAPLRHCTGLTRLTLRSCQLGCLPGGVLSSLSALADLDITNNPGLKCGSALELARLTALTHLDIRRTPISRLPEQLAALPALRSLACELGDQLGQGEEADWEPLGTRLRGLRLESRRSGSLRQLSLLARLSALVGLEDLSFDGSLDLPGPDSLHTTLEPLRHLTALTGLWLSSCRARGGLPPQLSALRRLAHLDISDNPALGDVEGVAAYEPLRHLTALTHLSAGGIGLRVLPPQLSACTRLAHLSLRGSSFMPDIPDSLAALGHLCGLTHLDLRDCGLQHLPPQLAACTALLYLDVAVNEDLGAFDAGIEAAFEPLGHLTTLTFLSIGLCGLRELPPQLAGCTALRELCVGNTSELRFADAAVAFEPLRHLASLTYLSLRYCGLRELPPQLSVCTALRELDISDSCQGSWARPVQEGLVVLHQRGSRSPLKRPLLTLLDPPK